MKKLMLFTMALISAVMACGQNTFTAYIKDAGTQEPLPGTAAYLVSKAIGVSADANGKVVIGNIPDGQQVIRFSYVGYAEKVQTFTFPEAAARPLTILLEQSDSELEAVEITSTRSTRTIQDIPTRVEFIAGEELEEKGNMKPGDIRMILSESTGIQTQQTSATSANASIRIQGLDGRYTQILKDGFPLYSGYAGGLGLLQTPPLDLKQVEIIKGSASTLYGGGAIAGLVNLISKTPVPEQELRFLINGTSARGLDLNGFYGKRYGRVGVTVFGARNSNAAYDPSGTNLSAIPQFSRYTLNPRLFFYPADKTQISFGVNTSFENRLGGNMQYIKGEKARNQTYSELNKTQRLSTQFSLSHQVNSAGWVNVKNSVSYFNRKLTLPQYIFAGKQTNSFSEVNYASKGDKADWVAGFNIWTEQFKEKQFSLNPLRNYNQATIGAFVQNSLTATNWLNLETGVRTDYVLDYGFAFLPRISFLFKINPQFTSRLGGGLGYKAPTIFTEESERLQYQGVLPISSRINKLERSYGGNLDFTYRTAFADEAVSFSINHLFFYTYLNHPLILQAQADNKYQLLNSSGHISTKGTETNIKIGYENFNVYLGYTFTNASIHQNGSQSTNPLTPKHRVNTVVMYEVEDKWKIGLESYYFARQKLTDGATGKAYVINGFMIERLLNRFSVYVNFENFLDVRQTRFDTIYTGSITNPVFRDIYAPLDGFVVNGGIKLKF